jgi:UDP-N-acetylmuramyl pentapeptide synthase
MAVALEALARRPARRRLAVLGDMRELGPESANAHAELGERAAAVVDQLFLIGDEVERVAAAARDAGLPAGRITVAELLDELIAYVITTVAPGDAVLVKASRALELEHVVRAVVRASEGRR